MTTTAEATTPLLELHGISKSFGSVQALSEVDFEVRPGEVMALVGDNGAGKSTLIKCVAGIHTPDSGEIVFDGEPVHIHGPKDAAKLGIEVVYQDLALCDNLDVVQNMYLGREARDWLAPAQGAGDGGQDGRDDEEPRRDDDPLDPAAGRDPLRRPAPVGRRRARGDVELAARDPRRADRGARRRADASRCSSSSTRLAEQGLAVVLISHNLHDIFEVADRITVLRLGRNVAVYEREKTTQQEVVAGDHRRRADEGLRDRVDRSGGRA